MADIVDTATRSRMMAGIRGKDTKPEKALRSALHAIGLRYRLHARDVPGRPDLLFPKFGAVVFVHGCFWHRHQDCRYATIPASRPEFWQAKFAANVARDQKVREALAEAGWRVATVWECALRKPDQVAEATARVASWLKTDNALLEVPESSTPKRF
ncbi:very short patch repair endonuclease [Pelagivirga sediminicola]|uniref:Very short patch repair endonuclease n=1 Tax=Pelagivirga sediminicola TaxID=2170575 RepID=A0A2T7GAJ4_9RHOB|nr:DNA mismatch endonuclease Vsr [Pelagivirga sediminicola]PVA11429.1 very short patch repair endonuclease [Pelagivirga sediminicola]